MSEQDAAGSEAALARSEHRESATGWRGDGTADRGVGSVCGGGASDQPAPPGTAFHRLLQFLAPRTDAARRGPARPLWWMVGGLVAWGLLVWQAERVGFPMRAAMKVSAAPLTGHIRRPTEQDVPLAIAMGLLLMMVLPRVSQRLPWRRMVAVLALAGVLWGGALAQVRPQPYDRALERKFDYPAVVPDVNEIGVARFVRTYSDPDVLAGYPIHVQGHPPGAALVFVALDRVGLGGGQAAGWFLMLVGAGIAPAVLLATREVAGERRARQAAPFLVLGPSAIWLVTSADALFAFVGAWAVTLLVLATGPQRARWARVALALAGGVAFGVGVHLSYGLVPLAAIPALVVVARRRWWVPVGAAAGGLVVVAAFASAGFWLVSGLHATHDRYLDGVSALRPFHYFVLLGNPAAFFISTGPVAAVALARVRDRRLWLLTAGALLAVVASNASGLSKGEVERIWLPFVPWVLVLAAGVWDRQPIVGSATATATATASGPINETVDGTVVAAGIGVVTAAAAPPDDGAGWLLGPVVTYPAADRVPRIVFALLFLQVVVAVVVECMVRTPW